MSVHIIPMAERGAHFLRAPCQCYPDVHRPTAHADYVVTHVQLAEGKPDTHWGVYEVEDDNFMTSVLASCAADCPIEI